MRLQYAADGDHVACAAAFWQIAHPVREPHAAERRADNGLARAVADDDGVDSERGDALRGPAWLVFYSMGSKK